MYIERMLNELDQKGIKKNELPDKLGISYGSVLNYLTGKRVMPINVFFDIMKFFELNVCNIMDCSSCSHNYINLRTTEHENNKIAELEKKVFELEIRLDECRKSLSK